MIRVEDLHKSFDGAKVLRGASFSVGKGEILALIGRSGYGKSVLLKHVQSGALFDSMTVFDNIAFPLREKTNLEERKIREKVQSELEQVGLMGSEEKYPSQISGGMIKRASLARALVQEPEIMLFDEPTTGLDPLTGQTILNLIDSCHRRLGFTGIIVTHEIPRIFEIVDKVAMLHDGVIQFQGTPEEITASEDPIVCAFLTGDMQGVSQG